jgi:hypothetical protein
MRITLPAQQPPRPRNQLTDLVTRFEVEVCRDNCERSFEPPPDGQPVRLEQDPRLPAEGHAMMLAGLLGALLLAAAPEAPKRPPRSALPESASKKKARPKTEAPAAKAPVAAPEAPAAPLSVPGADGAPVRVERRLLLKKDKFFATGGLSYLSRGDYYTNPGLTVSGTFYPTEVDGIEFRGAVFISSLSPAGIEVFERTGLVPDAHRPIALVAAGWRRTLGYGKVLVGGETGRVVHFDVQGTGHLGLTVTDRGLSPSLLVGPGVLMRFTPSIHAQLDVPLAVALEQRSRGFLSLGMLPTLTVGVVL